MKTRSSKLTRLALVLCLAAWAVTVHAQTIRTATAQATVVDGYVVGVTLTDAGGGYGVPPAVSFTGGGGSGAVAEAKVRNGVVDKIVLINAGSGYASQAAVSIAPPEMPMLESVRFMIGLTMQGRVGATHQILATDSLAPPAWRVRTNVVVTRSPYAWVDADALVQQRYYQVAAETEAPVLGPVRLMSELTIQGTAETTNYIQATDQSVWRVLTNVVVASSPYMWVDEAASTLGRQYQVSAMAEVPVEKVAPRHWAWIPPGMFTMGSPESEGGPDWEGPQTRVILTKGFWMGRCEVTQGEYEALMGDNPAYFKGDTNRPVEQVSWYDATNYCGRLTERERAGGRLPSGYAYRLPTEAEWEYACRAGTTSRFSFGDALECSDECGYCPLLGQYMWWCGNNNGPFGTSGYGTKSVGQKQPNRWGLYDMHGNVWEWCVDCWSRNLPGGSVIDLTGPTTGDYRVIRGGHWESEAWSGHSAGRGSSGPDPGLNFMGFRAVLAPGQP